MAAAGGFLFFYLKSQAGSREGPLLYWSAAAAVAAAAAPVHLCAKNPQWVSWAARRSAPMNEWQREEGEAAGRCGEGGRGCLLVGGGGNPAWSGMQLWTVWHGKAEVPERACWRIIPPAPLAQGGGKSSLNSNPSEEIHGAAAAGSSFQKTQHFSHFSLSLSLYHLRMLSGDYLLF